MNYLSKNTLADLKKGEKALIIGFKNQELALNLLEMGFLPQTEIIFEYQAPLGCPIGVKIGNSYVAIRKKDAKNIEIEKLS
jgi:ferrous iron transport protein A